MQAYTTVPLASFEQKRIASWLQVLSHLAPEYGGIATCVPQLARVTEAQGPFECPIVGFCSKEELDSLPIPLGFSVEAYPAQRARWLFDLPLRQRVKERIRASQGVHIHGLWEAHSMFSGGMARACKRPYVVSAHGMLDQWALRQKRLKKALYAAVVELNTLKGAACLHALTNDEVDDYRRLGLTNPIAVIPNGIEDPPTRSADLFFQEYPHLARKRIMLFLGRLHPKKGVNLLLRAWARWKTELGDAHLVIAGPDSEGTMAALQSATDELQLRSSVTFSGMRTGNQKWAAIAAASAFVLPSYSEGFSIAILEALAIGVPVMVTHCCHIPQVAAYDCGWVIPAECEPLEEAIGEFLRLSPDALTEMGRRGQRLAEANFRWPVIGGQMGEVYDWLAGGPEPRSVDIV